jgi:hypothetical protein
MPVVEREADMSGEDKAVARFGFWASLATGLSTLITFAIAIGTPPLSGPWCKADCYQYPFLDVASRFPRDYAWMFPAIVATLLFVAFVLAVQARARPERRLLGQLALVLAVMASLTIVGDYFVQLAVVQPSLLANEGDGISLLSQYNPHGLFIALEELGFLLMCVSLLVLALAMRKESRLEGAVRWVFGAGGVLSLASLGYFVAVHGHQRSYLFEIAVISIAWLTVIPGALMMTVVFRRARA